MRSENNQVDLIGTFEKILVFSHETYGEKFFRLFLNIPRNSGTIDRIPVIIPERLSDPETFLGKKVEVKGEYRSCNCKDENNKRYLDLFVFAKEIEEVSKDLKCNQKAVFNGYTCKPSIYRRTFLGREIAEMILAINMNYGKTAYIPAIAWGRNARFVENFSVGTHMIATGRIQSREYFSKKEESKKIAYEYSIATIEVIA